VGPNLRDIDRLSRQELQQFERWQKDFMNKQYYRQLQERGNMERRIELGDKNDNNTEHTE